MDLKAFFLLHHFVCPFALVEKTLYAALGGPACY